MSETVAVITGASSGIGRSLSLALCERGLRVVGVARREQALTELARERLNFVPYVTDLRSPDARARLADALLSHYGAPRYLVLNAGLAHYGRMEQLTAAQVIEQLEVNVTSVLDLTQRFLPALLAQGRGRILIISSVLGLGAVPYAATYVASKHAINGFVRALRLDLRGSGVSVSAVCPAGVRTEFSSMATGIAGSHRPGQESLAKVTRGIVRQLDRDRTVLYPTLKSHWLGMALRCLPRTADWFVATLGRGPFERQLPPERLGATGSGVDPQSVH